MSTPPFYLIPDFPDRIALANTTLIPSDVYRVYVHFNDINERDSGGGTWMKRYSNTPAPVTQQYTQDGNGDWWVENPDVANSTIVINAIKDLPVVNNDFIYFTSNTTANTSTVTPYARTLLDDANANTARITLGLNFSSPKVTIYTSGSNTHVFDSNCVIYEVIVTGGGGGGGGATTVSAARSGGGGGGGASSIGTYKRTSNSASYSVGSGGAGGNGIGGSDGTGSTWSQGSISISASGGGGGDVGGSAGTAGGTPGTANGGLINLSGQQGGRGIPGSYYGGKGGDSGDGWGHGNQASAVTVAGGFPGQGPGAGGSGAIKTSGSNQLTGGDGNDGQIIVKEILR